jgi:hypothetical protein
MGRLLSSERRGSLMPILRYIVWVGTSLLALLFVANWFLPEPHQEAGHETIEKPVIRITSVQRPADSVLIDTNQPTTAPPPMPSESTNPDVPSPLQAYASVELPLVTAGVDRNNPKDLKRQRAKVAPLQVPSVHTHVVASGNQAATVPPTKLSFLDILSGAGKSLFNLR